MLPHTFGNRVLAFYQNARGEYVLSYAAFKTLDPYAICEGRLKER
jgi:hypothetical protein